MENRAKEAQERIAVGTKCGAQYAVQCVVRQAIVETVAHPISGISQCEQDRVRRPEIHSLLYEAAADFQGDG